MSTTRDKSPADTGAAEGIAITRVLDAPRGQVFRAWTDPAQFAVWWGPEAFTTPVCKIDARSGGVLHYCMRSSEGQDYWGKGVYREVVAPERIVYVDSFSDPEGNLVAPERYGMSPSWPAEMLLTLTLAEDGGRTRLALHHAVGAAPESEREQCRQGWTETLNRLGDYLAHLPMATGARSAALARQFESRARGGVALLEGLGKADWEKTTSGEQWTVAATAHHLAGALGVVAGMAQTIASGQSVGNFTRAALEEMNASQAREHARADKDETIALFKTGAATASAAVRRLTNDQLDRSGTVFADMAPMTVEQLVVNGLVNHVDEHVGSIRKAAGR